MTSHQTISTPCPSQLLINAICNVEQIKKRENKQCRNPKKYGSLGWVWVKNSSLNPHENHPKYPNPNTTPNPKNPKIWVLKIFLMCFFDG